jgi:toxin FitB
MGTKIIADTNILIYFLNGEMPVNEEVTALLISKDFAISALTLTELLSWKQLSEDNVADIVSALEGIQVIPLTKDVAMIAANLKRKYPIKLADSVIAATAIKMNRTLATNDLTDFKQIPELQLIHPYS